VTWSARFRVREWLRGSLWVVPIAGGVIGLVLSELSVIFDRHVSLPSTFTYSTGTAASLLSTVVGAMIALTGFVVTISVLVVQMATGTFSARYMRLWYRDPVLKAVLAWLIGTLTFSYSLLRRNGSGTVPGIGVTLAGIFVSIGLVLFLVFLDRFVHRLRPVAVASVVARAGRRTVRVPTADVSDATLAAIPAQPALTVRAPHAGAIQAYDRAGLLRFAEQRDALLVLPHAVGDYVSTGDRLVEVHGPGASEWPDRELLGLIALGVERTIEQDVAFALRVMVDIANKALSAAVNDPTTAIQVLNQLGDTLLHLGRTPGLNGVQAMGDTGGRLRVVMPAHRFEDLLSLGVTEIRIYGVSAIQVMRRLRSLLEDLRETVLEPYAAAVDAELARLDATVAERWGSGVDGDLAEAPDPQGIGGAPSLRARLRAVRAEAS
jgi:uncharacterized membrane protein